jgi:large subunit GTPase 1
MPGKTKHYQTLFLPVETLTNNYSITEKEICLMDCPGLVFPSFTSSKADMLVNGIYPIDQIKDYHSPIQIIILRLPAKILNNFYGIQLPDLYSAKQFLQILSEKRGFYTGNALPDEARTAKLVLRDYVTGKLLYCYLRPDYTKEKFGFISPYMDNELTGEENEKHKMLAGIPATFDDHYEKLYYEQEELLENKNVKSGKNFDDEFFQKEIVQHAENEDTGSKLISKDMKRELKFAMKRGEITEDEYDSVETVAEFKQLMERINKEKGNDKNSKNIIKTQAVNF